MKYTSLPTSQLTAWALLNSCDLHGVKVEADIVEDGSSSKGGGVMAVADHKEAEVLLCVPRDIVVSKEQIADCSRTDVNLRELLDALEDSGLTKTTRGLFLVFLLYQLTLASSSDDAQIKGVRTASTDYMKFLPKEIPLPTFYTDEERDLLIGTSLHDALNQKMRGMEREFEILRDSTVKLDWARGAWWGVSAEPEDDENDQLVLGPLRFEDWKLVDAMYRSRVFELPADNEVVMVPILDMANHAPDDQYNARFEVDQERNVMLVVRDGKMIQAGQEINIIYGCGGACEMVFSYGFLDSSARSAREIFLDLSIPSDDPLRLAKSRIANTAPGVRVYEDPAGSNMWESDFVWWACVNEEDGLDFEVVHSNDGQKELRVVWKGSEFAAQDLGRLLQQDELRDVFGLRSLVLVQQRVEEQGSKISESEARFDAAKHATGVRQEVWQLIRRLRDLELELLTAVYEKLETEKASLLGSETVRRYLGAAKQPTDETGNHEVAADDFS